jgi:uncharacterized protein (TIGR03435 family)
MKYWLALALLTQAPAFEVASVKTAAMRPVAGGREGGGMGCPQSTKVDAGRVDFECASLVSLIAYAFRISPARITGPDWMSSLSAPKFDIVAKLPDGASERQAPEMMQALLAESFQLATHRGTSTQTMYALMVTKGGLKMAETADPETAAVEQVSGAGRTQRWEAASISFASLADLLDRALPLDSPVIDMTGLKGRYRLALEVTLDQLPGIGAPLEMENTVLARFNEGLAKLGLHLERRKGPVETVVVDHVEKAPADAR